MRKFASAAVAVLVAVTLSSCAAMPGSEKAVDGHGALANPNTPVGINARRDPLELQTVAFRQLRTASSFHMSGSGRYQGIDVTIDLHFGRTSSSGRMTLGPGAVARFRSVNHTSYLTATPGFWKLAMSDEPLESGQMNQFLRLVRDKWVRFKAGSATSAVPDFTSRTALLGRVPVTGGAVRGPVQIVRGERVISFKVPDQKNSTVYVRADGQPYLVRFEQTDTHVNFDMWGKPYSATKPPAKRILKLPGL